MGSKPSNQEHLITQQTFDQSCQYLIKHQAATYQKDQILLPVKRILYELRTTDIQKAKEDRTILVNPTILKFVFSQFFPGQMNKFVQLLVVLLEDLNKKSLTFLKTNQIIELTDLADFILYFSNQKILETFDSYLIRSDICSQNKSLLREIEKVQGQSQGNGNIVEKMNTQQLQMIEKCLRIIIMKFINLRFQPMSRSETTLKLFSILQQSLFLLYSKLYFAYYSSFKEPMVADLNQHFKSNITIGAYFLSMGISSVIPSLYEASVVFLYSFLKLQGIEYKQLKTLPSHMFKNLPLIATHSIYEYIISNIQYSLKYIKEKDKLYQRFAFNRIVSLKLVQALCKNIKTDNKTIKYYFEQLCLQVKIGQIQRACLCQSVEHYLKKNPEIQSGILKKFIETKRIKYNLKFSDKEIKISKQQLMTQLQDEQDSCKKQYYIISYKFVLEKILRKNIFTNFNDKLLWQQLLPNIMNSKQDIKLEGNFDEKMEHISVLQPNQDIKSQNVQEE